MRPILETKSIAGMAPGDEAAILANCNVQIQLATTAVDDSLGVSPGDACAAQATDQKSLRDAQ